MIEYTLEWLALNRIEEVSEFSSPVFSSVFCLPSRVLLPATSELDCPLSVWGFVCSLRVTRMQQTTHDRVELGGDGLRGMLR